MHNLKLADKKRKRTDSLQLREENQFHLQLSQLLLSKDWLSVLTLDWLSSKLYSLLVIRDITQLDTAICNHAYRCAWLKRLSYIWPVQQLFNISIIRMTNWCVIKILLLRNVEIDKYSNIAGNGVFKLVPLYTNLKSIKILIDNRSAKGIECIADICSELPAIGLINTTLTDNTLINIRNRCKQRTSIYPRIKHEGKVTKAGLYSLLRNCYHLSNFIFVPCDFPKSDQLFCSLENYCPLLESLALNYMQITSVYIKTFTNGCRNLKTLILQNIQIFNTDLFFYAMGNCHLLEEFRCYNSGESDDVEDDGSFQSFAMGCPLLQTFVFQNFTVNHARSRSLVTYCRFLSTVELYRADITEDGFAGLEELSSLVRLDISYCFFFRRCHRSVFQGTTHVIGRNQY